MRVPVVTNNQNNFEFGIKVKGSKSVKNKLGKRFLSTLEEKFPNDPREVLISDTKSVIILDPELGDVSKEIKSGATEILNTIANAVYIRKYVQDLPQNAMDLNKKYGTDISINPKGFLSLPDNSVLSLKNALETIAKTISKKKTSGNVSISIFRKPLLEGYDEYYGDNITISIKDKSRKIPNLEKNLDYEFDPETSLKPNQTGQIKRTLLKNIKIVDAQLISTEKGPSKLDILLGKLCTILMNNWLQRK